MKEISKEQIKEKLTSKGLDVRVGWFYIQFKKKYKEEFVIDYINLQNFAEGLLKFLKNQKIKEILFFPDPTLTFDIPSAFVKTTELKEFLTKNVDTNTNTHVADINLDWILTITHEDDFFISGDKELVKKFISFFKDANCIPYKKIEAKWNKKSP